MMRIDPRFVFALGAALACVCAAAATTTQDVVNQVALPEYMSYLRVLTGVDAVPGSPPFYLTNRSSFSLQGQVAAQWMQEQMASWGLDTSLHVFDPAYAPNVIGELRGTTRPNDIYIISSHFDTTQYENPSIAPACDDNGSGTATVLMAARILSHYQFQGTLRFVSFSGEEEGLVGSDAYAYAAECAGENIVATINLDMILHPGFDNYDPDPDYDLDIATNYSSQWLGDFVAARFGQYTSIDVQVGHDYSGGSDHASFWWHGFDAVDFSENSADEIWGGSNDTYHQATDTIYNPDFDWDFAQQAVRGSLASLTDLAVMVPEPSSLALLVVVAVMGCDRRSADRYS
jgi:hypothetical protein